MKDNRILIGVGVVAIIVGVVIFIYSSKAWRATNASESLASAVSFAPLARGADSNVSDRVNYLITSPDQLKELWKAIGATSTPPAIDFDTQEVIAVFAGSDHTIGITVANIKDAKTRMVSVSLAKPDGVCAGKGPWSPYQIVVVPVSSLPLDHQDFVSTTSCPE